MSSNLPPGVSENMIPGNRPQDVAYDQIIEGEIGIQLDKLADLMAYDGVQLSYLESELVPKFEQVIEEISRRTFERMRED